MIDIALGAGAGMALGALVGLVIVWLVTHE
jgi:hypothetical protein